MKTTALQIMDVATRTFYAYDTNNSSWMTLPGRPYVEALEDLNLLGLSVDTDAGLVAISSPHRNTGNQSRIYLLRAR